MQQNEAPVYCTRVEATWDSSGIFSSLGPLVDPSRFHEPLDISGCDVDLLIKQLRDMLVIRYAEEYIGDMVTAGKVRCPAHLGIGEEAVAAAYRRICGRAIECSARTARIRTTWH